MALQLALLDFDTPESLDGVRIDDLVMEGGSWDSAVLKRALEAATELGIVKRVRRARILVQQDAARSEGHVVCSAKEPAHKVPEDLVKCWQDLERKFVEAGVSDVWDLEISGQGCCKFVV